MLECQTKGLIGYACQRSEGECQWLSQVRDQSESGLGGLASRDMVGCVRREEAQYLLGQRLLKAIKQGYLTPELLKI